ncbi:hypothetical protein OIP74_000489 [Salmonella enterica]|nr:hypothetical protein [Salmonella enterica]EJY8599714.1 hypothetical protein [Salmonella enterica]EJZ7133366.1 hypothetical protein [Salmonella enterica]
MQEVKIYTAPPSDLSPPVQSESFCVDMVLASDYAELEETFMAQGVEMAITHIEQTISPNHETVLNEYAAKIRKGVQS